MERKLARHSAMGQLAAPTDLPGDAVMRNGLFRRGFFNTPGYFDSWVGAPVWSWAPARIWLLLD
jgi:hypothetical protein